MSLLNVCDNSDLYIDETKYNIFYCLFKHDTEVKAIIKTKPYLERSTKFSNIFINKLSFSVLLEIRNFSRNLYSQITTFCQILFLCKITSSLILCLFRLKLTV